ncbi:MAG: D-aminoacyl-tRNA deacylase [Bacteroidales bacterium]
MRAVIQRVKKASVSTGESVLSAIGHGMVILVGVEEADSLEDVEWLASKVVQLRIFDDEKGVMNLSVRDVGGDIIIVSQFTLHALTKKGNRPSYIRAAQPEKAIPVYESFVAKVTGLLGKPVGTGKFGAMMLVEIQNDGPVTIMIDTKNKE